MRYVDLGGGDGPPLGPGTHPLPLAGSRDFLVHLPAVPATPSPLVVSLHGADGDAQGGLSLLATSAEAHGFAGLLASDVADALSLALSR